MHGFHKYSNAANELKYLEAKKQIKPQTSAKNYYYGIWFSKDNIDVAGFVTTAACKALTTVATQDAETIRLLKNAGAIVVGKTNLDQFATGLVGTRSPFGAVIL